MKLLNFDESELQVNRNGRLSEKQKARLIKEEKSQKGCAVTGGVLLFGIALIGVAVAVIFVPAIINEDRTAAIAFGAAFGCFWPLVWGGIGFAQMSGAFAKMEVEVKKAAGPVNIVSVIRESYNSSTKMHSEYSVYELRVGKRIFEVESELANLMMQGDVYAMYYAEFNLAEKEPEVLSAELIEKRQ